MKKITSNCKKATFLIEKKQIGDITTREKLELRIHLAYCPLCRIFEHQSKVINQFVHDLRLMPRVMMAPKLDDGFKQKM